MKKYSELKEDLFGALGAGLSQGLSAPVVRPTRTMTRPSDRAGIPKNAGFRENYRDPSGTIRTSALDYDLVKLLDDWCNEMGWNGYPTSKGNDLSKYGYDQYYEKSNGWTGTPRHAGGLAVDMFLVKSGGRSAPIATYARGTDESKEMFEAMKRLSQMAKQRRFLLSVGCGIGYMGARTMHVDITRGELKIPFPRPHTDRRGKQLTTNTFQAEHGHKAWYKEGDRTGIIRWPTNAGKTWGGSKPAWLVDLHRHL